MTKYDRIAIICAAQGMFALPKRKVRNEDKSYKNRKDYKEHKSKAERKALKEKQNETI